jgi:hypothetical protein
MHLLHSSSFTSIPLLNISSARLLIYSLSSTHHRLDHVYFIFAAQAMTPRTPPPNTTAGAGIPKTSVAP